MDCVKKETATEKSGKEKNRQNDNPEDCQVCMVAFDDVLQRPRTLPCGHTFCTTCVNRLTSGGQVTCSTCRVEHMVPDTGQFPINFTLEAFIARGSDSEATSTNSSPRLGRRTKVAKGLGKKIRAMLNEQEAKVTTALEACQSMQEQLSTYHRTLSSWSSQQQQLEDRLQAVINDSKSARVLVRQEQLNVLAKQDDVQNEDQRLHEALDVLRLVATEDDAGLAVVDVLHYTHDAHDLLDECRAAFPDPRTITAARTVREASMAAVEAVKTANASLPAPDTAGDHHTTNAASITDKIQTLLTPTLKAEDLRSMTVQARSLIQGGMVVAVTKMDEKRHSSLSLQDGRLFLHALQDHPPPTGVAKLQMSEVLPATPPCLVFLDFAWPDTSPSRVLIRLSTDTPMGRQFLLLCTGERGPGYLHTKLWRVRNRGKPGESICGGDYERNDGTGGASVLPDLEAGQYWRSGRAGAVWGWSNRGPAHGTIFGIVTRDRQDGRVLSGVFGEVVKGLEVLLAAAQHHDIMEVSVVDCGVVICGALVPYK